MARDDPDQSRRALAFLREVEVGSQTVTTCEGVLEEAVYVLSSHRLYNLPRQEFTSKLSDVLQLRGLQLPYKGMLLRALELYAASNLDFVGALAIAHMERVGIGTIVSFDRDFDRIPQLLRI